MRPPLPWEVAPHQPIHELARERVPPLYRLARVVALELGPDDFVKGIHRHEQLILLGRLRLLYGRWVHQFAPRYGLTKPAVSVTDDPKDDQSRLLHMA